jgi:hypothetical protein
MKKKRYVWLNYLPLLAILCAWSNGNSTFAQVVGEVLPPWTEGMLDIHQISTGRGNSALFILPDATTMLMDAGTLGSHTIRHVAPRPDDSRAPGEWIARYIEHVHPVQDAPVLDYALLTHFHGDHMGGVEENSKLSNSGKYKLSGITEVAEHVVIRKMLDRGWPDYNFPSPMNSQTMENYRVFLKWQAEQNGLIIQRFQPGRNDQIILMKSPEDYPNFEVRNVVANGQLWTGVGTNTQEHFPPLEEVPKADHPSENPCSIGFRLSYGQFDYFSGGDMVGIPGPGGPSWHDVETPVARAVGPVEASILNHHGYIDSQNAFFVSTLRPLVWIISVWDSAHPTSAVYARLRSTRLYPGPRDIFATSMHEANKVVISGLKDLASNQGHILIRVAPGGNSFHVIILSDSDESLEVTAVHGPYQAR